MMISQTDLELLNAYLDGALDDSQRADLEARLATNAALRRELDAIRTTSELVQSLPTLRAPRDFTLTPEVARRARTIAFPATAISLISAAASILLIVIGISLINPGNRQAADLQTAGAFSTSGRNDEFFDADANQAAEIVGGVVTVPTGAVTSTQRPPATQMPPQTEIVEIEPSILSAAGESAVLQASEEDGAAFEAAAATVMLEQVENQATQIAQRTLGTPTVAPPAVSSMMADMAPAAPVTIPGDSGGAGAASAEMSTPTTQTLSPAGTQAPLYGVGIDAFAATAPAEQETADMMRSMAETLTLTASTTPSPTLTLTPTSSVTPTETVTATLEPTDDAPIDVLTKTESETPIGALLIGIGGAIGIFAIGFFIWSRRR